EETVGRDKLGAGWDTLLAKTKFEPAEAPAATSESPFTWTAEATARLDRVPAGVMRDMTRGEGERGATAQGGAGHDVSGGRGRHGGWGAGREEEDGGVVGLLREQEAAVARGRGGGGSLGKPACLARGGGRRFSPFSSGGARAAGFSEGPPPRTAPPREVM